jgi:hypothetical protein
MRKLLFTSVCVVLWVSTGAASAIEPDADGFGTDSGSDGSFETLDVSSAILRVERFSSGTDEHRSVIDFPLASIPAGSVIHSATLELEATALIGVGGSLNTFGPVATVCSHYSSAPCADLNSGVGARHQAASRHRYRW